MSDLLRIHDERYFPPFASCPSDNSLDLNFYLTKDNFQYTPKHHWCLLAEIVDVGVFIRLSLNVRDKTGEVFRVMFYLDDPDQDSRMPTNTEQFRPGHTVAIMYAHQHYFLDFSVGIRQESMKSIKVISAGLDDVISLGEKIITRTLVPRTSQCDSCGAKKPNLRVCAKCTLAAYCDRECQRHGWEVLEHRKECKTFKSAKDLFCIDWDNFDTFISVE